MTEFFSLRTERARLHASPLYSHPTARLWQKSLSIGSQFCEAVVGSGLLTWEQMVSAASRYCLGATRHRGVIFWQIDHEGRVHDGKVMYYQTDCHRDKSRQAHPTWVSALLRRRSPLAAHPSPQTSHCLFGLHLLEPGRPCAIVESEKTAFVLSERFPDWHWLATGGLGEVQTDKFRPLRGHQVVMFPDTDTDGIAYRRWSEAARLVMHATFWEDSPPIRVSPMLEQRATAEQKQQKIDLLDFLLAPP